jgi:lipoprotein-anchoring transpeptidase ErfK/SrfK
MKKILTFLFFFTALFLNTNFSYAKDFSANFSFAKVNISVVGKEAVMSITNTNGGADWWGRVEIWANKDNINGVIDSIFKEEVKDLNVGQTKHLKFSGLDTSKKTTYYFTVRNRGGSKNEILFSTFWYGLSFDKKNSSGGYDMAFFGDPKDQREMFLALSKSSDSTTVLTEISNQSPSTILFPLGKLATKTGDGFATISLPPEKQGRYYAHLIAKNTSGSYEVITQHRNTIVFGNSIGEIFYNKLGKSDFEKTGTNQYKLKGSIDATKHKELDIVPLSTITISGVFYDLKYKQTVLTLPNITPNKDGSYEFDIKTNGIFNDNTNYGLRLTFSSSTGASAIYEVKGVNTSKGYIIPETGKEAEDFLNKNSYRLLAPIPGMTMLLDPELCREEQRRDPGQICDINAFLNFLLQLAIGAAAVVLVVRIIISGYGYMLTDVPYIKVKLKGQFIEAMIGLVVALSSYLILNTVNPKLVSNNINIKAINFEIVDFPDAGDDSIDPDFKLGKATYSKDATISPGTVSAVKKLEQGWEISRFIVFTNNRMLIELKKGQDIDNTNLIDISPGKNGYAPEGTAKGGDNKTPIGTWKIIDIRYKPGVPQFNGNGSNMGAAFWHLSPTKSGERGIGMHGTKTGGLSATNGCIRMKNTDLLALQPYVKKGIPVIVKQ